MINKASLFYLMVAIATMRYCSVVERIARLIPVLIFSSCRVNSPMFARSSVLPREELRCIMYHRAMLETLSLFLGADVSDNKAVWGSCWK